MSEIRPTELLAGELGTISGRGSCDCPASCTTRSDEEEIREMPIMMALEANNDGINPALAELSRRTLDSGPHFLELNATDETAISAGADVEHSGTTSVHLRFGRLTDHRSFSSSPPSNAGFSTSSIPPSAASNACLDPRARNARMGPCPFGAPGHSAALNVGGNNDMARPAVLLSLRSCLGDTDATSRECERRKGENRCFCVVSRWGLAPSLTVSFAFSFIFLTLDLMITEKCLTSSLKRRIETKMKPSSIFAGQSHLAESFGFPPIMLLPDLLVYISIPRPLCNVSASPRLDDCDLSVWSSAQVPSGTFNAQHIDGILFPGPHLQIRREILLISDLENSAVPTLKMARVTRPAYSAESDTNTKRLVSGCVDPAPLDGKTLFLFVARFSELAGTGVRPALLTDSLADGPRLLLRSCQYQQDPSWFGSGSSHPRFPRDFFGVRHALGRSWPGLIQFSLERPRRSKKTSNADCVPNLTRGECPTPMAQPRTRVPSLLDLKYGLVNSESTSAYLERKESGFTKSHKQNSPLHQAIHRNTLPQCKSAVKDDPITLDPIMFAELGFPLAEVAGARPAAVVAGALPPIGEPGEFAADVDKPAAGGDAYAEMVRRTTSAALRVPAKTLMRSAGASLEGREWGRWNEEKAERQEEGGVGTSDVEETETKAE
ncbi:hypothetical protein K438DRAFT_2154041 [Mycena galopus ATCC 62051]|nr:hypothetical protein K438DRAFT_2154041 [Mycena galopus ATCC 62051]